MRFDGQTQSQQRGAKPKAILSWLPNIDMRPSVAAAIWRNQPGNMTASARGRGLFYGPRPRPITCRLIFL